MPRFPASLAVAAVLAVAAGGCAGGEVAARQVPAFLSGRVLAGPPCPPDAQQACVGRTVPGAVVVATGKDGTHRVAADGAGSYGIALLTGEWTLVATTPDGAQRSPGQRMFLRPGQALSVDLRISSPG